MINTTLSDIAKLLKTENDNGTRTFWGKVAQITTTASGETEYKVSLDGTTDNAITCKKMSGAAVGDIVFGVIRSTGEAVVINTKGGDKDALRAVCSTVVEYALSTSETVAPTSGWSTTAPEHESGKYMWMRTTVTKNDGTTTVTTTCIQGADGEDGQDGQDGEDGQDGADGKTIYATSSTSASTATKVATVSSGTLNLSDNPTVAVKFTNANTASNPKLNVGDTGAKAIYTNGLNSAYWEAGATVLFTYDGSYWHNASQPVYASQVTVGNAASKNVYIDSNGVNVRDGSDVIASFDEDSIELCDGNFSISHDSSTSYSKIESANSDCKSGLHTLLISGNAGAELIAKQADGTNEARIAANSSSSDSTAVIVADEINLSGTVMSSWENTFVTETYTKTTTSTITAGNKYVITETKTKEGYYPIGIVGVNTNSTDLCIAGFRLTAQDVDEVTYSVSVRAIDDDVAAGKNVAIYVLWAREY